MSITGSRPANGFIENVDDIGAPKGSYPDPSCHILSVVFDELNDPWVLLSARFDGKLKMTSGGALEGNETIVAGGLRELEEESPALPIQNHMIRRYAWQHVTLTYTTFALVAFDTDGVYNPKRRYEILTAHNAADQLAKKLLDLAFMPEEQGKDIQINNLVGFDEELARLVFANNTNLSQYFLKLCQRKLVVLNRALELGQAEQIKAAKKDLLETIRIKTEFVGRQFVRLVELERACEEVLRIDAIEKSKGLSDAEKQSLKKPEFAITSSIPEWDGKKCKLFGVNVKSVAPLIGSQEFACDVAAIRDSRRKERQCRLDLTVLGLAKHSKHFGFPGFLFDRESHINEEFMTDSQRGRVSQMSFLTANSGLGNGFGQPDPAPVNGKTNDPAPESKQLQK